MRSIDNSIVISIQVSIVISIVNPTAPIPTSLSQWMWLYKYAGRVGAVDADGCLAVCVQEAVELIVSNDLSSCLCPPICQAGGVQESV